MAVGRVPLGAHDGGAAGPRLGQELRDSGTKRLRLDDHGKACRRLRRRAGVLRFPAQRPAQVQVGDVRLCHRLGQRPPVELRMVAAVRGRPHIAEQGDPARLQERHEMADGVIGVADGPDPELMSPIRS